MIEGWEQVTIASLAEVARGGSPRPIKKFITDRPDGINWIKIGDTEKGGRYIDSTSEKIIPEGLSKSRWVEDGDFLLSNSMSFGRPYILRTSGCVHDGWLVLKPDYSRIDQAYLYFVLSSPQVFSQFDSRAAGSTVRNLNIELVSGVTIPLPPLDEQKRIVAVLDQAFAALDRARANAEANLFDARNLMETAKEAVLQEAESSGGAVHLADVASIDSMLVDPRLQQFIDMPHLGAGNMISGSDALVDIQTAKEEGLKSGKFLFDERMILYSKIRPYLRKAARPDFRGLCSADVYPLLPSPEMDRNFLFHILLANRFTAYAISGSDRAGMPKVNRDHLFRYEFKLPGLDVQRAAVKKIDSIMAQAARLEAEFVIKLEDIAALRQSLLQQAFSGQLTS
ncbi:restriction endonuclease subunit S [Pseudoxanthomonas sp.]|uniref:restriction endonuclease subunit S n=1 Tax=Pseudoxanthomonas sp. TaxID=1871049 RepID=UPI0026221BD3|nr:restriction endonuclease subunit S [Pseudoxanthomonas sp.]WDS37223.1 MAG: restriction endonuclease subunit S [Pseudoxanthomonas sp.]